MSIETNMNQNYLNGDEAHQHFMRVVYQVNNIACLFEQKGDGSLSAIFVTPAFARMMECATQEEALKLMDGENLFMNTYPEDLQLVRSMLKNRVAPDGTQDLTVRRITCTGNIIWCTIHYAFIDDYGRHYIYCTYADITRLKRYEEQLQSVYTSLGESFHKTDDDSLARLRANLTRDLVEEANGASYYVPDSGEQSFSEALKIRASYFPIAEERRIFLDTFSTDALFPTDRRSSFLRKSQKTGRR